MAKRSILCTLLLCTLLTFYGEAGGTEATSNHHNSETGCSENSKFAAERDENKVMPTSKYDTLYDAQNRAIQRNIYEWDESQQRWVQDWATEIRYGENGCDRMEFIYKAQKRDGKLKQIGERGTECCANGDTIYKEMYLSGLPNTLCAYANKEVMVVNKDGQNLYTEYYDWDVELDTFKMVERTAIEYDTVGRMGCKLKHTLWYQNKPVDWYTLVIMEYDVPEVFYIEKRYIYMEDRALWKLASVDAFDSNEKRIKNYVNKNSYREFVIDPYNE